MGTKRIPSILAAAALSVFALSLTQCIVIPHRSSNPDPAPGKSTVQVVTPKPSDPKPAPAPRVVYRIGEVVSVTGTLRHDGHRYFIDDDKSNAVFKFDVDKSLATNLQKNLNRKIRARLRITSVSGQVYETDFISF
jgi:hypothetical protein